MTVKTHDAVDEASLVDQLRALLEASDARIDELLTSCGEEGLTQPNLLRWLRARHHNPAAAAKSLTEHAAWRSEFVGTAGRIEEVCMADVRRWRPACHTLVTTRPACDD